MIHCIIPTNNVDCACMVCYKDLVLRNQAMRVNFNWRDRKCGVFLGYFTEKKGGPLVRALG